ncbi:hypothetical protein HanPI659440_Chr14g0564261 [Helianthus annuus]|nr:hypothetical protein HanPI659440_Chr14g0564261 [Helianthus annuus]
MVHVQSIIRPKEIHSININPSCPYQLGFHLQDGRSGVLDMHNFQVSHIHCPPPSPWLDGRNTAIFEYTRRKPSWLTNHSIYVVPSTSSNGLLFLDFNPHSSSPCHVDYVDSKNTRTSTVERKQSAFVPLSKRVTACVIHPLNDTIVAGTMVRIHTYTDHLWLLFLMEIKKKSNAPTNNVFFFYV